MGRNRRSLHCAPPNFLLRVVALIKFMRFPTGNRTRDPGECREVGNPGTLRSG
jgi:hypothetical protein